MSRAEEKLARIKAIIDEPDINFENPVRIISAYADGGCKENGVGGAYGSYMIDGNIFREVYAPPIVTNNLAEYYTLVLLLQHIRSSSIENVHIYMDSKLVVNQVNRIWKVKDADLMPYCETARELMRETGSVLSWVDRNVIVGILGH